MNDVRPPAVMPGVCRSMPGRGRLPRGPACTARPERTVSGMAARGHGAARRWAAVGALVAVLVATPPVIGALPGLRRRGVRRPTCGPPSSRSADVGFSGYAESAGGLAAARSPTSSPRSPTCSATAPRCASGGAVPTDHRVDVITAAGETGTHRDECGIWTWEYERATATRRRADAVRAARAARPAAHLAGPPAAVRGHRRGADPDRRPPGRRPRRASGCGWSRPRRRRRSAGSTSGWTPTAACRCRCEVYEKGGGPAGAGHPVPRPRGGPPVGGDHRLHPAGRVARPGGAARPRSCSRPDGGSTPCRCRTSWPVCRAVSSRACRPASASTAAGSPCSRSRRCRPRLAGGAAQRPRAGARRRPRRRGHPAGRRSGRAHAGRAAGPGPLRADRHGHPRRARRRGRASCRGATS